MDDTKNDVSESLGTGDTPSVSGAENGDISAVSTIIPQSSTGSQGKKSGGRKRWSKNGHTMLHKDSKVRSLAVKCYEEQLPYGWQHVEQEIQKASTKYWHIVAIWHYKDTYSEGGSPWKTAVEKRHLHLIMRRVDGKSVRVGQILCWLGIYFRPGIDDDLWKNHGVETVDKFSGYTMYLTHETEDAIADGKEPYSDDELVSNLSPEELDNVREGYIRVSNGRHKLSHEELVELDDQAFKLGYELRNFDYWYDQLSLAQRSNSKMKIIKESYDRGVAKRIQEKPEVLRLCVFIQGESNTGKTFGALRALSGKRVKTVEGGGTGKFDDLRADHQAIVISDDTCPNLLNVSDNYICRVYKRRSNNPVWAGQHLIVTSNLCFGAWLEACGLKNEKHIAAATSRFFICRVEHGADGANHLALLTPSTRGSVEEQRDRAGMFSDFQQKFNKSIAEYNPELNKYDFSALIDVHHRTAAQELTVEEQRYFNDFGLKIHFLRDEASLRTMALKKFGFFFWEAPEGPWCQHVGHAQVIVDMEGAKHFLSTFTTEGTWKYAISQSPDKDLLTGCDSNDLLKAVEWVLDPDGTIGAEQEEKEKEEAAKRAEAERKAKEEAEQKALLAQEAGALEYMAAVKAGRDDLIDTDDGHVYVKMSREDADRLYPDKMLHAEILRRS